MKKVLLLLVSLYSLWMQAQHSSIQIVPQPVEVRVTDTLQFRLQQEAAICLSETDLEPTGNYLSAYLEQYLGLRTHLQMPVKKQKKGQQMRQEAAITLINLHNDSISGGYRLSITPQGGVTVQGNDAAGVFYGVQTLIQLLPTQAGIVPLLPAVEVTDYPRFAYRGMHLDVVRHFFPVAFIKRYLDYMALHKLNFFHWHLTDDQGWRIQLKCRPELTEVGAYRDGEIVGYYPGKYQPLPYGGYYTQEEVAEVVRYAQERHITVIPEIDIPGHCMAVLATYPAFSTTPDAEQSCARTWGIYNRFNNVLAPTEEVFTFLSDVFTELCSLFPGPYIHLGGDECAKKWWKASESTQQFMREQGLKDEKELQSYFVHHVQEVIQRNGKRAIGWDEVLEGGISKECIIMNWRRPTHGIHALEAGNQTIFACSGWYYLNKKESRLQQEIGPNGPLTLQKVYEFEAVPDTLTAEQLSRVMGVQGCLWTEYTQNTWKAEFNLFPRLAALAESAWSQPAVKSWEEFSKKMVKQIDRYELWGARYNDAFLRQEDIERKR